VVDSEHPRLNVRDIYPNFDVHGIRVEEHEELRRVEIKVID